MKKDHRKDGPKPTKAKPNLLEKKWKDSKKRKLKEQNKTINTNCPFLSRKRLPVTFDVRFKVLDSSFVPSLSCRSLSFS